MAAHYLYLDDRKKHLKHFSLKIAIIHNQKKAYILTGFQLTHEEWDEENKKIKSPYQNTGRANAKIARQLAIVGDVMETLKPFLKELTVFQIKDAAQHKVDEELKGKVAKETPEILRTALESDNKAICFFNYAQKVAERFYLNDQGGSARTIEDTIDSLKAFTDKSRLLFREITVDFIKSYEHWYLQKFNSKGEKNSINGFGFRAKEIRRVFNAAIKESLHGVTTDIYPFGRMGYSIKKQKTGNRKKSAGEIAQTFDLKLMEGSKLDHHLNYFKYYFECWGMNFMDVAYLRVSQVQNGWLKYARRKTKWSDNAKKFNIKHSKLAQDIIDLYVQDKAPRDFVFPILEDIYYLNQSLDDKEQELGNKKLFEKKLTQRRANHIRRLKTIAKKAGLETELTSYMARHSFFSIALRNGVDKSEISEMAGHADYQTTEVYLNGFDDDELAANADKVRNAVSKHQVASKPL